MLAKDGLLVDPAEGKSTVSDEVSSAPFFVCLSLLALSLPKENHENILKCI
jgi:hypothetical protein